MNYIFGRAWFVVAALLCQMVTTDALSEEQLLSKQGDTLPKLATAAGAGQPEVARQILYAKRER
ncbi:MAG: hypothetical protein V7632_3853 [Bradyrhizobium sp.]|jgi:hypothetical protein